MQRYSCQDKLRGNLLLENTINEDRTLHFCPVAPKKYFGKHSDSEKNVEKLKLPIGKKYLLYSGYISYITNASWLIEIVDILPKDWVLVITAWNMRDLIRLRNNRIINHFMCKDNVHIFQEPLEQDDFIKLIQVCHAGLAFYTPDYENWLTGKNLQNIGLASGKFSNYISAGLPVITTAQPVFIKLAKQYSCARIMNQPGEVNTLLAEFENESKEKLLNDTQDLFQHYLSPIEGMNSFIKEITKMPPQQIIFYWGDQNVLAPYVWHIIKIKLDLWYNMYPNATTVLLGAGTHTKWLLHCFAQHPFMETVMVIFDEYPDKKSLLYKSVPIQ